MSCEMRSPLRSESRETKKSFMVRQSGAAIAFLAAAEHSARYFRKKASDLLFGKTKHIRLMFGAGW